MGTPNNDIELRDPPQDGISAVKFSPIATSLLLVSSWDGNVRLYDTQVNMLRAVFSHQASVLDCAWAGRSHIYSGGLDMSVKEFNAESRAERVFGHHDKAVRCLEFSADHNVLVTGSWDATVKLWDPRSASHLVATYLWNAELDLTSCPQSDRVFAMDLAGHRIVVGTAGRNVNIWDIRKPNEPEQRRESSLKYQTRAIRAFPDRSGYALSSIEGRVSIEYFDPSPEMQAKKFAFKCHRVNVNGVDTVYPVNAIAFHPGYGTFATGGCDGVINFWDGSSQRRLRQLQKYPTSIASLGFNSDGTLLAVASSYTYEEGEKDHPPDTVFLHRTQDVEVKPKPRGTA